MKLFDSHCHLDDKSFDKDIDVVINNAYKEDIRAIMIVGITHKSSIKAVSISESKDYLFASIGIHPHDAKECSEPILKSLINLAKHPKVYAWGEIGLDFNRMYSPKATQEKWFILQLETASKLNLPIIFHERESKGRFLEILKDFKNIKGVVHCFSGNKNELESYLDIGLYIGITGIVTIKNRGELLRELIPYIPCEYLLIETDAPYLTPEPQKKYHRRNEPAFVRSVLLKLAELKKQDINIFSETIWNNTCRLFNVKP